MHPNPTQSPPPQRPSPAAAAEAPPAQPPQEAPLSLAQTFRAHVECALAWEAEPEFIAGERWTLAGGCD